MAETNEWRKHWTSDLYAGWEKDQPIKPDAGVDVNGKTLTGGLAQPHTRVEFTLTEATEQLSKHIQELSESVNWASDEILRLRAENERLCAEKIELELKVENLRYMIRTITQGQTIQ